MMEMYAAEVDGSGTVLRVIVGDASWAADALGGMWVDTDTLVGIGWMWDGEQLIIPAPVYDDDEGADEASTV